MSQAFHCVLILLCLAVAGILRQPVEAVVMTFDTLASDFSELTTYTEDSLTLAAINGVPDHFHPNDNFDNGTTGADLFGDDGTPFRITAASGGVFDLISVYVFDIDTGSGPIVLSTGNGATHNVSARGLTTFGPAFAGVSFVQIDIPGGTGGRLIGLDDITVTPEPTTLVLILLGLVSLLGMKWQKVRNTQ